jgi:hypothetical protein
MGSQGSVSANAAGAQESFMEYNLSQEKRKDIAREVRDEMEKRRHANDISVWSVICYLDHLGYLKSSPSTEDAGNLSAEDHICTAFGVESISELDQ